MALETFKARLKAKFSGVNLSQKRIDAIADRLHKKNPELTEEADHDAQLDALNELMPFADMAKDDDRLRTLEKKEGKPTGSDPKPDPTKTDPPADDMPAWAKALLGEVQSLKQEKAQTSIRAKAAEKLKDIPEKFWGKRALPEKEEDLEAFIQEVDTDWKELKQDGNNAGLGGQSAPAGGSAEATPSSVEKAIENWAGKGAEPKK